MARVKVQSFISSTSRYAKSAAAAADKNKDTRISKAEARALPKNLQDDYARQSKSKSRVGTKDFASDQVAYVASNAHRADKNKDGILSAAEAKTLPKDVQDNEAAYRASLGGTSGGGTSSADGITGKGRGKTEKNDDLTLSRLPVTASAKALAKSLTDTSGITSFVAAWKGTPADLADVAAHPEAHKEFLNQLLFHGTGTGYRDDYPDYYSAAGLEVSTLSAASAKTELAQGFLDGLQHGDTAGTAKVNADAASVVNALGAGPNTRLLKLFWTNHDDASFCAIVALDTKSGSIRGAGYVNEP